MKQTVNPTVKKAATCINIRTAPIVTMSISESIPVDLARGVGIHMGLYDQADAPVESNVKNIRPKAKPYDQPVHSFRMYATAALG